MKKILFITCLVFILIFVVSCNSGVDDINESNNSSVSGAYEESGEESVTKNADSSQDAVLEKAKTGKCEEAKVCISSVYIADRNADCSISGKKKCTLGCVDNACKIGETCDVGFACLSETWHGYRKSDCSWTQKSLCENGCADGSCVEVNNSLASNMTENSSSAKSVDKVVTPAPSSPTIYTVQFGSSIVVSEHEVSIYNLEPDKVRISIDGKNSEWLSEGANVTLSGLQVFIKGVYLQSYQGGKQEVDFSLE